jgi:hypothetical protein
VFQRQEPCQGRAEGPPPSAVSILDSTPAAEKSSSMRSTDEPRQECASTRMGCFDERTRTRHVAFSPRSGALLAESSGNGLAGGQVGSVVEVLDAENSWSSSATTQDAPSTGDLLGAAASHLCVRVDQRGRSACSSLVCSSVTATHAHFQSLRLPGAYLSYRESRRPSRSVLPVR